MKKENKSTNSISDVMFAMVFLAAVIAMGYIATIIATNTKSDVREYLDTHSKIKDVHPQQGKLKNKG